MNAETAIVILAAGKGKRMESDLPKVLHVLNNKPLLHYIVDCAVKITGDNVIVVTGYKSELVKESLQGKYKCSFAFQDEQLGTGHAVKCALPYLSEEIKYVIPLCGDVPLLTTETIRKLQKFHLESKADVTVLVAKKDDPTGYGRIISDKNENVLKIVEEADAAKEQKKIKNVNSGIYCINKSFLEKALDRLTPDNNQKEYYLTDIVKVGRFENKKIKMLLCEDSFEISGINTVKELEAIQRYMATN